MRTWRVSACRGDVSAHELMYEDGAASHALQDDETGPVVADLCAACGAEYANRVATVGCTVCSSRLALGLTVECDPEFGGYCGGCAVEAATTSVRSEFNGACAIAVSNAITPLRNELTPLREQNVAFAMEIEELNGSTPRRMGRTATCGTRSSSCSCRRRLRRWRRRLIWAPIDGRPSLTVAVRRSEWVLRRTRSRTPTACRSPRRSKRHRRHWRSWSPADG